MGQFKEKPGDVSMRENREIERDFREERDRREQKESLLNDDRYRVYNNKSISKGYEIIVYSYDSKIGHFNIAFEGNGKRDAWLGANVDEKETFNWKGLKGGIYNETDKSINRIEKILVGIKKLDGKYQNLNMIKL